MTGWIVHHPHYDTGLPSSPRLPMGRYDALMAGLRARGLAHERSLVIAEPVALDDLLRVHEPAYVEAVLEGRLDPAQIRQIGYEPGEASRKRHLAAVGATIEAARIALERGVAFNMAGGSHHAHRAYGSGYCVFNDVAVAAARMLDEGQAGRILVLDLDVHQGDGTAAIFEADERVFTLSLHCQQNFPQRKARSNLDVALDRGTEDRGYLSALEATLAALESAIAPDLAFYLAGVDPHVEDRLGLLALSDHGLKARDRRVFAWCAERALPVVCVKSGGYGLAPEPVVARHLQTYEAAAEVFRKERR